MTKFVVSNQLDTRKLDQLLWKAVDLPQLAEEHFGRARPGYRPDDVKIIDFTPEEAARPDAKFQDGEMDGLLERVSMILHRSALVAEIHGQSTDPEADWEILSVMTITKPNLIA